MQVWVIKQAQIIIYVIDASDEFLKVLSSTFLLKFFISS